MTTIKFINVFFLQWIFVRLTKHQECRIENYRPGPIAIMPNGSLSQSGTGDRVKYEWLSIQYFILPLSGWWGNFIFLNKKPRFKNITKPEKSQNQ